MNSKISSGMQSNSEAEVASSEMSSCWWRNVRMRDGKRGSSMEVASEDNDEGYVRSANLKSEMHKIILKLNDAPFFHAS